MREIKGSEITKTIKEMCIKSNVELPEDVKHCINCMREEEPWEPAKEILDNMVTNFELAKDLRRPICQDTGMACVFLKIGQEVHVDGNLEEAIQEGIRQGYQEGYLRKSIVGDPLERVNTGDNTPGVIYYEIVPGDQLEIELAAKGFGSENMSRIGMLKPSDGIQGVKEFVIETVKLAGPNPCPPIVVGIGIGGTFDKVAFLSKKALLRPLESENPVALYANLEKELLEEINKLGIGPQGFGGKTTALGVNIETYPTHIAGLPVAVNISCHVARHIKEVL